MESEFIHESNIREKTEQEKRREIIESIILTRKELQRAHHNFEYAEEDLIDYYSYQIKANQSKLDYLTRQAKINNLSLDIVNNIVFKMKRENNEAV